MELKIEKPIWQVLAVGTLAGLRSAAAPAITGYILSNHRSKALAKSNLGFLQSGMVANGLKYMALAEFVGDKLPGAPNRIKPVAIAARCLSGALAGAGIFKARGGSAVAGALLGSIAACAATFGSFFLRKATVKATHIADPLIGVVEDALVVGAGISLAKTY